MSIENPYLTPPQVAGEKSRSWAMGFAFGFQGPAQSTKTPAEVQPEDIDAFNEGVLVGQDAAMNGFAYTDQPCIDLHAEGPSLPDVASKAPEVALAVFKLVGKGFMHGLGEGLLALVELSIALETFTDDPDEALGAEAQQMQLLLQQLGYSEAMTLYIGGGVDLTQTGCELKTTPIFRSLDASTAAAKALGRPKWFVASWRTDQSGGVEVLDGGSN